MDSVMEFRAFARRIARRGPKPCRATPQTLRHLAPLGAPESSRPHPKSRQNWLLLERKAPLRSLGHSLDGAFFAEIDESGRSNPPPATSRCMPRCSLRVAFTQWASTGKSLSMAELLIPKSRLLESGIRQRSSG